MKNILVVSYSQSGQGRQIVGNVLKAFEKADDVNVYFEDLQPDPPYQFPWRDISFWDAMPECVKLIPGKLKPFTFNPEKSYDLIVLEYPIWFLSPPRPVTTFLKSPEAAAVMKNKPVVTVIGSRNMWVNAQEDIKKMIAGNGGKLVGNIVLRDRHQNIVSVVTIIYWMLTAKKERFLGIFPKPGISDKDIADAVRFGTPLQEAVKSGNFDDLQQKLLRLGAVEFKPDIVDIELRAKKIFHKFAAFILKKGASGDPNRYGRVKLFKYYLLFVIAFVSPLVSLLFYVAYPFKKKKFDKKLEYFSGVAMKKN